MIEPKLLTREQLDEFEDAAIVFYPFEQLLAHIKAIELELDRLRNQSVAEFMGDGT